MRFEVLLHIAHLLAHGFFGILLHAAVYGGVDFEAVFVGIEVGGERFHFFCHCLAEVEGIAVISTLDTEFEFDGLGFEVVVFLSRKAAVGVHIVQHDVATLQSIARIALGIVGRSGFEQTYKYGCFFCF